MQYVNRIEPSFKSAVAAYLLCALLYGCATQLETGSRPESPDDVWRVHCETEKSYQFDLTAISGIYQGNWVWAESENQETVYLQGQLEGGYFRLKAVVTESGRQIAAEKSVLRGLCSNTIARDTPRELARVLAARDSRDIDVPIVFPDVSDNPATVSRLVVFGDSLSDTGRLKHRMQVFPGSPYWLGRFSNGPVWPDYLEQVTALAVQNRSYGGASISQPHDIDEAGLAGFIKDEGRFFVSGSIADQVSTYLEEQQSSPLIANPDTTAYLIWAGANDYISKEPISGLITTFLNSARGEQGYKSVAEETVSGILALVQELYQSGGRRFLVVNMPDLGLTPIVLQNDSYSSGQGLDSDSGRRIELSRRLRILSEYHNEKLADGLEQLRAELQDTDILLVDSHALGELIVAGRSLNDPDVVFDYGFALESHSRTLAYEGQKVVLQGNCYDGAYLGSLKDNNTCDDGETAFFWDVIHPGTLTHCWQAYLVGDVLADKGWIEPMPLPESYKEWCLARTGWTGKGTAGD